MTPPASPSGASPAPSPVALAYMLGNLAARGGGAVPGRVYALAAALEETGDLAALLSELDPALAGALATLISTERSRMKFGPRAAVTG